MKAIINSGKAKEALLKISPVTTKLSTVPIISCAKLSFEKNTLYVIGTDLETTIVSKIECECKESFETVIEYDDLINILKSIPNQPITLDCGKKGVSIITDNGNFNLAKGGEVTSFPKIPDEEFLFSIEVNEDFFSSIYNANSCRNKDDLVVNMNTACMDFKEDVLTIVGTDAFVMFKEDLKIKTGKKHQSLVRDRFVQMVKEFSTGKLSIGERFVKAERNGDTIITRVQDNRYCGYEAILPSEINYNIRVGVKEFAHALKQAMATADKATTRCVLYVKNKDATLSSTDLAYSKNGEVRFRVISQEEIEPIAFNGKQMLHVISMIPSDEVDVSIRGPKQSMYFKPTDDDSVFCLLQPIMA
jgi:DNA polymerase III subunit beta